MRIHIIRGNGTAEVIRLLVKPSNTVEEVKAYIKEMNSIPIRKQKLTFANFILDDDRTLSDCGIRNESCIGLSVKVFAKL